MGALASKERLWWIWEKIIMYCTTASKMLRLWHKQGLLAQIETLHRHPGQDYLWRVYPAAETAGSRSDRCSWMSMLTEGECWCDKDWWRQDVWGEAKMSGKGRRFSRLVNALQQIWTCELCNDCGYRATLHWLMSSKPDYIKFTLGWQEMCGDAAHWRASKHSLGPCSCV